MSVSGRVRRRGVGHRWLAWLLALSVLVPGGAAVAAPVWAVPEPPPGPVVPPCSGQDCIPQPTTAPPTEGPHPTTPGEDSGDIDCGFTNIGGCIAKGINTVFRDLVTAALSPVLDLLGHTALRTPTLEELPGIGPLWNNSWQIVLAGYGMLIMVGGIVVMSHESLQARYSIKEIAPRIPIGFLASALSLFFAEKMVQLANALSAGVLGEGVDPPSLGSTLSEAIKGAIGGGLFLILLGLVLVVIGIGLLVVYVVRVVVFLVLIITGPLFLMCHCLPHTDPLARWWWKALSATLAIQVAQSVVLITATRTFLAGGVQLFGPGKSALGMMVAAIALFFVLFKIPFWLLSAVKVSSGRSLAGGLVRAFIAAKTFGMVAGKVGAFGKAGAARGASSGTAAVAGGSPRLSDPSWPPPRMASTPDQVTRNLHRDYDAERLRAAQRPRPPSQALRFVQPAPQQSTHDPAVTPTPRGSAAPRFSAKPISAVPRHRYVGAAAPVFHWPGGTAEHQVVQPIPVASVPAPLRFQPSVPESPAAQPSAPPVPPPAPVFRAARPEPRIGDARPRTLSVPPVAFRPPPPPAAGG